MISRRARLPAARLARPSFGPRAACVELACVLSLAMGLAAPEARADDARALEVARRSFEAGMEQYRSGDLEGARISLTQSYAAWPSVETLRNLAIAELNTDHALDALQHFRTYARDRNADPGFVKTKLPAYLERCEQRVGHLRVVAASGAAVTMDGRRLEAVGDVVDVAPGMHTVVLTAKGKIEARATRVPPGRTVEVDFVAPGAAGAATEWQRTGTASAAPPDPLAPPGAGPAPASPSSTPPSLSPEAASDNGRSSLMARNTMVITLSSVALVAAGVGVAFGVAANGNSSGIDTLTSGRTTSTCATAADSVYCSSLRSLLSAQRSNATASDVAFGLAGVLAAGAVVAFVAWPKADTRRASRLWLAPSLGAGSGALVAGGLF